MAKLLLVLIILFGVAIVGILAYNHILHPLLFKEELEETLEGAVEEKTRKEVKKKAKEILNDDDVKTKEN